MLTRRLPQTVVCVAAWLLSCQFSYAQAVRGVPYSAQAVVTEHFMRFAVPEAGEWLTVRTVIDDPTYLVQPFMTSTNFKREADGSKWNPKACRE